MTAAQTKAKFGRRWTAQELRRLNAPKRDAILRAAAKRAQADYRTNRDLICFEAFAKEDFYGDSSN